VCRDALRRLVERRYERHHIVPIVMEQSVQREGGIFSAAP
jgi:hypothetical protein